MSMYEAHPTVEMTRIARANLEQWTSKGYVPFTDANHFVPALKNLIMRASANGTELAAHVITVKDALVVLNRNDAPCLVSRRVLPGWMVHMAKTVTDQELGSSMNYEQFVQATAAGLEGDLETVEAFFALIELSAEYKRGA